MPSRNGVLLGILAAGLIPVYWIAVSAPAVGMFHDDAIYVVTAKALAEGKGYRIISLPGEIVQTKYPILFPLVLAGVWKVFPRFPDNAWLLKLVPLLCTVVWCWIAYRLLKEETRSVQVASWIAILTAASPYVLFFSATLTSETLFACLSAGAVLWLAWLEARSGRAAREVFFASLLTAASFLTRVAGMPLIAAGTVSLLLRRRYKDAFSFFVICAVLIAPWIIWQSISWPDHAVAPAYYSAANYRGWNVLLNFTLAQKAQIIEQNLAYLIFSPVVLFGVTSPAFGPFFAVAFCGLALWGLLSEMRKELKSLHLFLLFYCGMVLGWAWPPQRFLVPVLPLLLLFAYKGFLLCWTAIAKARSVPPWATQILVLVLAVSAAHALYLSARGTLRNQAVTLTNQVGDSWQEVSSLMAWVREHTPPDAIILGNLDAAFYLYTGRKTLRGFEADPFQLFYAREPASPLGQVSDLARIVLKQRASYIVRMPNRMYKEGPFFAELMDGLVSQFPEAFTLVKSGSLPGYRIYRVDAAKLLRASETGFSSQPSGSEFEQ